MGTAESPETTAAKNELYADALDLYERTRAEVRYTNAAGINQPYVAHRLKEKIDAAHEDGTIVAVIAEIAKRRSDGFGRLEDAGRPDLAVEVLVVDETKPYHRLFSENAIATSRGRLAEYVASHSNTPDEVIRVLGRTASS